MLKPKQVTAAKVASRALAKTTILERRKFVSTFLEKLEAAQDRLIQANRRDLQKILERTEKDILRLTTGGLDYVARSAHQLITQPDVLNRTLTQHMGSRGLRLRKVTTPFGVIGFINQNSALHFIQAIMLAVYSGNALVYVGTGKLLATHKIILKVLKQALRLSGFPEESVVMCPTFSKDATVLEKTCGIDIVFSNTQSQVTLIFSWAAG